MHSASMEIEMKQKHFRLYTQYTKFNYKLQTFIYPMTNSVKRIKFMF